MGEGNFYMTTPVKTLGLTVLILALTAAIWGMGYIWEQANKPKPENQQVQIQVTEQATSTKSGEVLKIDQASVSSVTSTLATSTAPLPASVRAFDVFFSNTEKDPNMLDCSKVYPVKRWAVDSELDQIAEMNLHALLLGPTVAEQKAGYITEIPQAVADPKLRIEEGKVYVDFDQSLEQGMGGSCRVTAVRSQIEETVKAANPDFKGKVVISVNGRTEDILQP